MKEISMDQVKKYWTANMHDFIKQGDPGVNIMECKIFFIRGFIEAIQATGCTIVGQTKKDVELYFKKP